MSPPRPWGLPDAIAGYIVAVVASIAASSLWTAVRGSPRLSLGAVVAGLLGFWLGAGVAMAVAVRRKGSGRLAADLGLRLAGAGDVALGAAAGLLASLAVVPLVYAALIRIGWLGSDAPERLSAPAQRLAATASGGGFVVLALFVGVGAPIVEECFFRGFFQPAAVRRFGPAGGLVVSAGFFAAAHAEALQFPGLAVLGLILGALAWRTGRLGPGIVAHVVFNGLTLVRLASAVAR